MERIDTSTVKLNVPPDAAGTQIHLILNVSDNSTIAAMRDYCRIVINVQQ